MIEAGQLRQWRESERGLLLVVCRRSVGDARFGSWWVIEEGDLEWYPEASLEGWSNLIQ